MNDADRRVRFDGLARRYSGRPASVLDRLGIRAEGYVRYIRREKGGFQRVLGNFQRLRTHAGDLGVRFFKGQDIARMVFAEGGQGLAIAESADAGLPVDWHARQLNDGLLFLLPGRAKPPIATANQSPEFVAPAFSNDGCPGFLQGFLHDALGAIDQSDTMIRFYPIRRRRSYLSLRYALHTNQMAFS